MGTIHCIPKLSEIDSYMKLAEKYKLAFEYNEFFSPSVLSDPVKRKNIIDGYKALGRDTSNDTLHGAFFDVNIASDDPEIAAVSDKRIRQSIEAGLELGVRSVILHTNFIANFRLSTYRTGWVSRSEDYYRRLTESYPDLNIYVENMFDEEPELLKALCKKMSDVSNFGACLDLAHAYISKTKIKDWVRELSPYVRHVHINDNLGSEDLHLAVGEGTLPWSEYNEFMKKAEEKPSVLVEVSSIASLGRSLEYMEGNGLYPFI